MRFEKFDQSHHSVWDEFVRRSKNGVFLFERGYMDYHADRFTDHSLLCFDDDTLIAVLPGNLQEDVYISHGGLTFGGFVVDSRMRAGRMLQMFESLAGWLCSQGAKKLVYKAVPHIYHRIPAEEDLYALFALRAHLFRRDVAATILMAERPPYAKGRKWAVKKGNANVTVARSENFDEFMKIEEENLSSRYGVKPVHTSAELSLLAARFPANIALFEARKEGELLAGVVVYESAMVAHAQYIGTTEHGRELFALDAIVDHLLSNEYAHKRYFDFGISTERAGRHLNTGLMENKESYGGRAIAYDFYELELG